MAVVAYTSSSGTDVQIGEKDFIPLNGKIEPNSGWSWVTSSLLRGVSCGVLSFLFEQSIKALFETSLKESSLGVMGILAGVTGIYLARKEISNTFKEFGKLSSFSKVITISGSFALGTGTLLIVVYFFPHTASSIKPRHIFLMAPLFVFNVLLPLMKAKDEAIDLYFAKGSPIAVRAVIESKANDMLWKAAQAKIHEMASKEQ